jgi:tripartite-type tricarboxylate transporter receptor subunit TctC
MKSRLGTLLVATAVSLVMASAPAAAFPERAVTIIVPWAAGGGTDAVVRIFAAGYEQELGVPVNVVNRAGGGGVPGHSEIVNAEPDGYTLGAASPEITFYQTLGQADFGIEDLDLFSRLAVIPAGVTVAAESPYESLDDLLQAFQDEPPGTLTSSGTGVGGSWHVAGAGMLDAAGLDPTIMSWVPSAGGAPALQEVVAGTISMFTGSPVEAIGLLDAGRVRTIAIFTDERQDAFEGVPTAREQGVDWTFGNFFALVAPHGIDPEKRDILYDAAQRAHARSEVQRDLMERGITPVWDEPGEFEAYAADFAETAQRLLTDLGLAVDQDD